MRRARVVVATLVMALAASCAGDGDDDPVVAAGDATTTTAPPTTTSPVGTSTTVAATSKASTVVIEPDNVAGLGMGATKTEVIAVLGTPSQAGQETDVGGGRYDYLRWELDGNRGLTLNFRTPSVTSPLLTDWIATAKGPRTTSGIQVGDSSTKVVAAHGALQTFCCEAKVVSVEQGAGRMIIVVPDADGTVRQIIGGDESFWSRSIAD